jgi:hypothetical protein
MTSHAAVQARLAKSNNRTRSSAFQPSLRRAAAAVSCGDSVRSFGARRCGNRSYWHHGSWPDDPPPHDGVHACARTGRAPQLPHACRQHHIHHTACSHEQHWDTDDDGQDVVCETGPRQTAVDDTHVATGRHRVVDAPG